MMRHLLKPIRITNSVDQHSWSSKQRINPKDLVSLQKDLLALFIKLENPDSNTMGIMTNTTWNSTTQNITMKNILENILINHGNG